MKRSLLSCLTLIALLPVTGQAQEHKHSDDHAVGAVTFPVGCSADAQKHINTGVAMLHSFWFVEARKTFEAAAQADPKCGVAHWGVALTHFGNPFAGGPGPENNKLGHAAAAKAASIGGSTPRDQAYIAAAQALYKDYESVPNRQRMMAYRDALAKASAAMPDDMETSVFHGLWVVANASPLDMTFADQKKAADIMTPLFERQPTHPGLAHYIIHAFDSPPLAKHALDAARRYAELAPAAPHALHMPSHTFTRLGYWDESIKTNRRSADLEPTPGAKSHAADYMVYAYLQQGRDHKAKAVLEEIGIDPNDPTGVVGQFAGYNPFAMPARFALEREDWKQAASLAVPSGQPAFVEAITRFARAVGAARSGDAAAARTEIDALNGLTKKLTDAKDPYWPIVIDAQRMAAEAWVLHLEGKHAEALAMAAEAAEKEELVEKHPVTPGPLIPARELHGDILLVHGKPAEALKAYEKTLEREPNRLRTLIGAAKAAKASGNKDAQAKYRHEVMKLMDPESPRIAMLKGLH